MTQTTDRQRKFIDPIRNQECTLVVPVDGRIFPTGDEPKIGVRHPGCEQLADVSPELDAFYCPPCGWNGRVSGMMVIDLIEAERVCRACGCTDMAACPGGCRWVEDDLCSRCV